MSHPLETLLLASRKPRRIVVGLMSGTSADSIDVAVCRIGLGPERVELLHYEERPNDPAVQEAVHGAGSLDARRIAELHVTIGERFADACLGGIKRAGLSPAEIDLVGSHGQTVYHHSSVPGAIRATLQLGDGDVIAERTGLPVISDFRARDVAAGGEGAPLSPRADLVLFPSESGMNKKARVVLNLGGIGNVTRLDPDPNQVIGFDTGPANSLLDRLARRLSQGRLSCDRDGAIALSGRVDEKLVAELIRVNRYLTRPPPKSTGFEMFGDAFVDDAAARLGREDADLMATLTEFTARTVAHAIETHLGGSEAIAELIVAGGGSKNPALMSRITRLVDPIRVVSSDARGIPSDAREAMIFAVLADLALRGETSNLPGVTGASRAAVLGKLSFPRPSWLAEAWGVKL